MAPVFTPLPGNKGFGPVGLCPLHHVVGVGHVPLAPSLRYSPSGDPEYPSYTAKAARARLLGLCCLLPPASAALPGVCSFLSCWSPLVSFPPRPRFVGFVCPPCGPLSWLVLVAPPALVCPLGVACFLFCLVCLVLRCVVRPWLVSLSCVLLLVASPHVILVRYARIFCFHLRNLGLYYNWTCVSVRRLDRFTCAVGFHRLTILCFSGIV